MVTRRIGARLAFLAAFAALASGCAGGGGGGGGDSPVISPPPPASPPVSPPGSPPPPPPPPPPPGVLPSGLPLGPQGLAPTQAEYDRNPGLARANPIPAWSRGVTGRGVTVAVIDSGAELGRFDLGNLSPLSSDINATRNDPNDSRDDQDKHGTFVAGVVAAEAGNGGIVGIAYGATILSIRADQPGACTDDNGLSTGCPFTSGDLAAAINRAVAQGASVINLSLGGEGPLGPAFETALRNAALAGVTIVVAAGNESELSPSFPAAYATDPRFLGAVVAVGALNRQNAIASFSNQAGGALNQYLVTLGDRVVTGCFGAAPLQCYGVNGTSFSAPQVAGAVALLKEFSPQLTPAQLLAILYSSAADLGVPGVDQVYGRGELNIGNAFQPIGALSIPTGPGGEIFAGQIGGIASPAMGDALTRAGALDTVGFDQFGRTFETSLAPAFLTVQSVSPGAVAPTLLAERLVGRLEMAASAAPIVEALPESLRMGIEIEPAPLAFLAETPLPGGGRARIARGYSVSPPLAFGASEAIVSLASADVGAAYAHPVGRGLLRIGFSAGEGRSGVEDQRATPGGAARMAFAQIDTPFAAGVITTRIVSLSESEGLLGLTWDDRLGARPEGRTVAVGLGGEWPLSPRLSLSASAEVARASDARGGLISVAEPLTASAGSLALRHRLTPGAALRLVVWQPLRVEDGALSVTHATATRWGRDTLGFATRAVDAAPSGREVGVEVGYSARLSGQVAVDVAMGRRFQPGHVAAAPAEDSARLGVRIALQ